MKKKNSISRRSFLKSSAMAGALGAIGTGGAAGVVLTSCSSGEKANALKPLKEPLLIISRNCPTWQQTDKN